MMLGAALRLYRLREQSIWLDEYPNILYLNAPDLHTYLTQMRLYLPEQAQAPFYYCILYYFAQFFGTSVPLLRVLSIAIGLTAIPLVYLLGRHLSRPGAGLIAALCLALSPQCIWYSQEIRPSPLVAPLVILSLYALFRALRGPGKWWWLVNVAANILLLETQLLNVVLLPVEALLACFYLRSRFKAVMAWGTAHVLFLVPWGLAMLRMPASYTDEFKDMFVSGGRVLRDMLLDDVVNLHDQLMPPWKTGHPGEGLAGVLLPLRPMADGLLVAVILLVLAWFLVVLTRAALRWRNGRRDEDRISIENGLVLLALIVIPVGTLGLASWATGKPFQASNYAYYNLVGLYIILGAVLTEVPRKALRTAAVTLLVVLYASQLALLLPTPTREDWQSASKTIENQGTSGDLVLELNFAWPNELLNFYFQGSPFSAKRVSSLQGAFGQMDQFFSQPGHESANAWLVFEHCYFDWGCFPGVDPQQVIRKHLDARNLACRYDLIPGHFDLVCVKVTRKPGQAPITVAAPIEPLQTIDFGALCRELGMPAQSEAERQAAEEGLRRQLSVWPPYCKFFLVVNALDALARGDMAVAEGLARHAVTRYPHFALSRYALGMALFRSQGAAKACAEFEQAFALDTGLKELLLPFTDALCQRSGPDALQRECTRLHKLHIFCPEAFDSLAAM